MVALKRLSPVLDCVQGVLRQHERRPGSGNRGGCRGSRRGATHMNIAITSAAIVQSFPGHLATGGATHLNVAITSVAIA